MKQMFQKEYTLDGLGSKNTIRVLRDLYRNLNRFRSVSDISRELGVSRANIHRALKDLDDLRVIRRSKTRNRSLVRIDTSSRIAHHLFSLFNDEIYGMVDPEVRNVLSMIFDRKGSNGISMVVLFGSHARGTADERSDIDLIVISDDDAGVERIKRMSRKFLPERRIEVHRYVSDDLSDPKDLVVVDALLFGIALIGDRDLFVHRSMIESIERSYLLHRIRSAEENMERAGRLQGEGKAYFARIAWVAIGEVGSILGSGRTLPKVEIQEEGSFEKRVGSLKEELSRRGEKIWLT